MRFTFISVFALILFASFLPAHAEEEPRLPSPIQTLVAEGAQIRYLGRDLGMDGWVVIKNGQEQYFYVTPDQQAIVSGVLFNNKGDAVTLQQINSLRKKEGPAIDRLAGFSDTPVASKEAETATPAPDFTPPPGFA